LEPNLSAGVESKKASVYGRDYAKDLDAYFNDIELQQIFCLFGAYDYIQNGKHLSDIAGIDEAQAFDILECLKNLSLVGVNEKGYFKKTTESVFQKANEDTKLRARKHSIRLMQMASLYLEAEKFCDDFFTASTSQELILNFYKQIANAKKELIEKSLKLNSEDQTKIITFSLGLISDEINSLDEVK